jgi:flagellar basal body-associated protein FliL
MNKPPPATTSRHQIILILILVLGLAFIGAVLFLISLVDLSNRETTLLGTVLTLLSVGIGWGISHYYAGEDKRAAVAEIREFEQRNLRTYALKAAEKVTNLSKELNRLSAYLQEELQYTGYRNADEELFAKEERIESAIHMLESLRSINDTSLSDWQGVIGEELDEQREQAKEQAETLKALSERLSAVEGANPVIPPSTAESAEIEEIRKQIRALVADMSGGAFRKKQRPNYQQIETECPACNITLTYGQRAKEGDYKALQCKGCSTNLVSLYRSDQGFLLKVRETITEPIACPTCSTKQVAQVDEWPTGSATLVCVSCSTPLRVSRTDGGENIKVVAVSPNRTAETLTPELLEAVRTTLPAQPWPKGIHQTIATQLGVRATLVQKSMQHLIRTGVFMDQIDGVVCTTAEKLALVRSAGTNL